MIERLRVVAATTVLMWIAGCALTSTAPPPAALRTLALNHFGIVTPASQAEVTAPPAVLGRSLFWDTRLSVNGKVACASCHSSDDWSSDRRPHSITAKGTPTTLQSQPTFMAQDQVALRWYGDRRDGAHQAERSITGSMGFDKPGEMEAALRSAGYEVRFREAYPDAGAWPTQLQYGQALQAYQRTLRTPAPFDAFLRGDDAALDPAQRAGLAKFIEVGCVGCHRGALLGGTSMQKFGLFKDYWLATGSKEVDLGRYTVTHNEADRYVYRVPMLRNIAKTAPYFHDGSVARLDDAVRVMAEVQLGRTLPERDVADIVAFLQSLTGAAPAHYAPPR
ncbi:MAG TPA: cytochrome c peroxidase [Burkholderiaceae bacterium]|nr:cytochrome c peroxidase [Burkholderiaceae bacterium]